MAVKFSQAKEAVEKQIVAAFGDAYITTQDKKIYVWADDGGEKVQIAISLTGVKNQVGSALAAPATSNLVTSDEMPPWDESPAPTAAPAPTEPSQEELDNLANMLAKFGL